MATGEHVLVVVGIVVNKSGLVCKNCSDPKKMPCLILRAPQSIWLSDHFQTAGRQCPSRSQFLTRFDRLQVLRRHDRNKSHQVELTEFIGRLGGARDFLAASLFVIHIISCMYFLGESTLPRITVVDM